MSVIKRCLIICCSITVFSAQLYAQEIPAENIYLPKTASSVAAIHSIDGVPYTLPIVQLSGESKILYYINYLDIGMGALRRHDNELSNYYFKLAEAYAPKTKEENDIYLKILLGRNKAKSMVNNVQNSAPVAIANVSSQIIKQEASPVVKQHMSNVKKSKGQPEIIALDDLIAVNPKRPTLRLYFGSSILMNVRGFEKSLVVDEGFFVVKQTTKDQIQIVALRRGSSFLNIWDEQGRKTVYVAVVFPAEDVHEEDPANQIIEHEKPFRFSYANDYNTYYYGEKDHDLKRQSYDFNETFALEGQSPYGYMDSSLTSDVFNGVSHVTTYTVGLSRIPIAHTKDFNLRAFDGSRYLSPLTMPSATLRGIFADVNTPNDLLGVSLSHGQRQSIFGIISVGGKSSLDSYIDAARVSLFPKDADNRISINLARGYGQDREPNLAKHVYSVEASHRFINTVLNGEYASEEKHHSGLAGIKWQNEAINEALNFRSINKDFSTVSGFPSDQGEVGATWVNNMNFSKIDGQTIVDVYQQHLYSNPDNPDALNYDINGHVHIPLVKSFESDTSLYFTHTPGEVSPRTNTSLTQRISRSFDIWGKRKATAYVSANWQQARYPASETSDFNRYGIMPGIQIPITNQISAYANDEYSWIHEKITGNDYNPNVINLGVNYNKQFSQAVTGNFDISYRQERGVKGVNSYLSGEDSFGLGMGLTYTPKDDVSFFIDTRVRKVIAQIDGNPSYNDLDVRFGVRMAFDVLTGWDPHGIVRGRIYKDKNNDGKMEIGEAGIEGVKVKIGDKQVVTDKNGFYQADISAKRAMVTPVVESMPAGLIFSTPGFNKVDIVQSQGKEVNFGLTSQTGVYGVIYVDKNNNGLPDREDQMVRHVKVKLDGKLTEESDEQGTYYFRNIDPGKHVLTVDIDSIPIDMIPLVKLKHEIQVVEGTNYMLHIPLRVKQE